MQLADDLLTLLAAGATSDGVVEGPYPGLHYYRASEPCIGLSPESVARTLGRGKVKPRIETYPLAKVNEVRERLAAGNVRYRGVLQHAA